MKPTSRDVDEIKGYVLEVLGKSPADWPGGWPDQIELALIDAIYSVRARYGSRERKTGVFGAVTRWRDHRDGQANDLTVLAETPVEQLRDQTNNGKINGRYKAEIAVEAAKALSVAGIRTAADLPTRLDAAKRAYLGVRGCGPVTFSYFCMLLGVDDVKADRWVVRFVQDRLPDVSDTGYVRALISEVARAMGTEARYLDHAIWRYRRTLPTTPPASPTLSPTASTSSIP